jgi:hypothetical protein
MNPPTDADLGCQDAGEQPQDFRPGVKCRVVGVHLACMAKDIGKVVVVTRADPDLQVLFAHDDRPVTYRTNAKGRRVVDHDPRCIQTVYSMRYLRIVRQWPFG